MPTYWRFAPRAASVPRARHAVTEALPNELRTVLGSDLSLLTSELVTNALRHGVSGRNKQFVELILWPAEGHYWLAVSDPGTGAKTPALAKHDADSESGRGLALVDHIASAWTVRARPGRGTSVVAGLTVARTR
ncbi:ATP-binding protein [Streptomyces fuscigenes]|uniref:ATP-binding protein n=1 Tax=Streptomyces fuscigenes TaxID=1528880 RepID=UPI0027DFA4F6|nr:ATP-binding protein [Streptomyces fuscigenes]